MKLAYLILAHQSPDQLLRLLAKLGKEDTRIFIHLDAKANIADFQSVYQLYPTVQFLTRRTNIRWAGYSMLKATFLGMEEIMQLFPELDFIHLLSAADYPIQPIAAFKAHLAAHPGQSFMEWRMVYNEWDEAIQRFENYHLVDFPFTGYYRIQQWLNRLLPKRRMPMRYIPVGRSQWMTLSRKHVLYLLTFLQQNPQWKWFMQFAWAPDEYMIQTILYNSPHQAELVNNNFRYVDWSEGLKNPKTLDMKDWETLQSSGCFFARKFDPKISGELLDKIDQYL